jgi:transcription elongation GreA/GreB family factor
MIGTRKSTEDMRDVLRAEFRSVIKGTEDMRDILRAEFRSAITEAVAPINLALQRIENKLDHVAETQATHSEAIAELKRRA